jgi:hypothetical protein
MCFRSQKVNKQRDLELENIEMSLQGNPGNVNWKGVYERALRDNITYFFY